MGLTRREFLALAPLATLGTLPLRSLLTAEAQPTGAAGRPGRLSLSATRVRGFTNPAMDFQLLRIMSESSYGGASVGESLAAAARIQDGLPSNWVTVFAALAQRQASDARARENRGHRLSAHEAYLRASNSYRAAEYYASLRDPQHQALGLRSRDSFLAAMRLQDRHFETIRLPFEKIWLPAYFLKPSADTKPARTLLVLNGFDGTLEEDYFYAGRAALERGYNVLQFCGPGQMDTVRFYPTAPFIPDFERVLRVAMDYALSRPDVDRRRVALYGISMGGYFATRGAIHEPRLRAVIPSSPIVDLYAYLVAAAGLDPERLPDADDFGLRELDQFPAGAMPPTTRASLESMLVRFGQPTIKKTFQYVRSFAVTNQDLARIRIPALALIGSGEGSEPLAQFNRFKANVSGPIASRSFTQEEGADAHTQLGNLSLANAVIFDWLDETFA